MVIEWRIYGNWNRERFSIAEGIEMIRLLRARPHVEQATASFRNHFLVIV